jgi:hypothetical protein
MSGQDYRRSRYGMEPITLRLLTYLLEELDTEADEAALNSRPEHFRHFLFNRLDVN